MVSCSTESSPWCKYDVIMTSGSVRMGLGTAVIRKIKLLAGLALVCNYLTN